MHRHFFSPCYQAAPYHFEKAKNGCSPPPGSPRHQAGRRDGRGNASAIYGGETAKRGGEKGSTESGITKIGFIYTVWLVWEGEKSEGFHQEARVREEQRTKGASSQGCGGFEPELNFDPDLLLVAHQLQKLTHKIRPQVCRPPPPPTTPPKLPRRSSDVLALYSVIMCLLVANTANRVHRSTTCSGKSDQRHISII